MSEIKPVYQQRREFDEWEDIPKDTYDMRVNGKYQVRILYPAAAYEALQKENEDLKGKLRYSVMAADAEARFADEYKLQSEAQAKRIDQQDEIIKATLEVIEATADFARDFYKQADKKSETRVAVPTFKELERRLRTYLPTSKNGE